jgi:hypothetical protein
VLAAPSAHNLRELGVALAALPRRRDFKTVPMILDNADLWDADALVAVLAYKGGPKQSWDNTDLGGPWLNGMRNTVNAQVWSFRQPDFLCVSGTHGSAHLALYDQATWDKYQLAKIAGANIGSNTFIAHHPPPPTMPPISRPPTVHSPRRTTASPRCSAEASCFSPATMRSGNWRSGWRRQARIPTTSASKRLLPS